ncbi:hypothetical protein D0809_12510 [Flavobacterium circumlabens]|uniref:Uncharacterized protein n=1 Tax=Flavobacterium circumlabens TaxID=2133765 RepID=A0A4Y7UBB9_9FLAO|nr:hypothetical protein [Flavobacterium circumlabens]TCN57392.1 hypothetical protein EV142_10448 [Flavobacterium circumlabens]TEB43715.1 hypothetical protein D0809_12510 [Flavobacterium circumlabens]
MSQKIKKIVVLSFILIFSILFTRCQKDDDLPSAQGNQLSLAKNWFKEYESSSDNYDLFQNMHYEWNQASVTRSEDGTETIIVPVAERKKEQREYWEQKLYIYKSDEGRYSALLFEVYSNKDIKPESQSVDGGDFTGYMTVWDLKKGFVRGAKFLNNQVVEEGVAEFSIDRNKTNKAPETGDCIFSDLDDGCHNDGGDGAAIPLREVIVTGPSTGTPVIYTPRGPVIGGTTPGGYTSPTGGGGASSGGGSGASNAESAPPSCESFNFKSKTGTIWQESAVKNIYLRIVLLNEKGIEIVHVISYPQPILFGTPTNVKVGNTNITAGLAANASAKVLHDTMDEVNAKYARTSVSDVIVDQYFRTQLTKNYPLSIPGGRVQFNSTTTLPATDYKTTFLFSADCR